jgi:hypothetical protein
MAAFHLELLQAILFIAQQINLKHLNISQYNLTETDKISICHYYTLPSALSVVLFLRIHIIDTHRAVGSKTFNLTKNCFCTNKLAEECGQGVFLNILKKKIFIAGKSRKKE